MVEQRATTPKKPEEPKPTTTLIKDFQQWAAGRTGLTQREFAEIYASIYHLSPQDRKTLFDYIKTQEDAAKKKKEEEDKKAKEKQKKEEEAAKKEKEKKQREEAAKKKKAERPTLIISRTKYPKWWKDLVVAPISFTGPGSSTIVQGKPGYSLFIATIAFTVNEETNIVLTFGVFGASGSMDFGAIEEPRGMVIPMGESPAPCGQGSFTISSDGPGTTVTGMVVYYMEKEDIPKPTGPSRPEPTGLPLEEKQMPWNIP